MHVVLYILAGIGGLTVIGALWVVWIAFVATRGCPPCKTSHELNDGDN